MIFKEPQIKNFVSYASKIFSKSTNSNTGQIYFIKYNSKPIKGMPKEIYNYYKTHTSNHVDGKIMYLLHKDNNKKCIVLYGRDRFKFISNDFGSYISSKIHNGYWEIFPSITNSLIYKFILGWGLDQYSFKKKKIFKFIAIPNKLNKSSLISILSGIFYGKDLINIPSSDMGPEALEKSFIDFSRFHNVNFNIIKGAEIRQGFPLIHAVGKGSIESPRLLELNWGNNPNHPLIILIGKGVCFDTGGLDLKPSQYMRNMKKDMGGAASILSLAHIVIESKLKVNIKVLIPCVNNDIGPSSMRPGDVFNSRASITVEIGHTDAEGRLILADALTYANEYKPNLIIDFATLTGAARVALGPDLPAYFTNSDKLALLINDVSSKVNDPLWRLPIYLPYESWLDSDVADTNNISQGSFAGSVVAALFLKKFVKSNISWLHIDTYAWSDQNRAGHSKGGDILGVRSIYELIKKYISNH